MSPPQKSLISNAMNISYLNLNDEIINESNAYNTFLKNGNTTLSKIELVIRTGELFRLSDAPLLETLNSVYILIPQLLPEINENTIITEIYKYIKWRNKKK